MNQLKDHSLRLKDLAGQQWLLSDADAHVHRKDRQQAAETCPAAGFCHPDQINELAPTIEERDKVESILDRENIEINALVSEKKEPLFERCPRRIISVRRIPRYADPTRVYLNSVCRVPLLPRVQEAHYAMQMEAAQEKLFDMAFCLAVALESLYRIAAELKRDKLECADVLEIEEDQIDNKVECEKLRVLFVCTVATSSIKYATFRPVWKIQNRSRQGPA